MISRRSFLSRSTTLALGATVLPALAQMPPAPPGRLLFGVPPGSMGSLLAEGMLTILRGQLGSNYQLVNLDARDTRLATDTVKAAPPDGETLLQVQSSSMVLFPSMYRSLDYDPLTDFTPLALLGDYNYALTVGPLVPANVVTVDNYLDWVSDNPDYRDVGFSLYGSQAHLASLILARTKEVALRPQPYRAITAQVQDLQSQSLAASISLAGNMQLLGSKDLRPLAVTGSRRLAGWPDVPTFAEQGVKDMDIAGWYGWFAPANMPATTADTLRAKIRAAQATPEYAALQQRLMLNQVDLAPEQIRERIQREINVYAKLVESYNLSRLG